MYEVRLSIWVKLRVQQKASSPNCNLLSFLLNLNLLQTIKHLNINSIRDKFDASSSVIEVNMDMLIVLEIKIDSSFSQSQIIIEGYALLFRQDIDSHGGDILLFIREDIPVKKTDTSPSRSFEGTFVELRTYMKKFFLYCSHKQYKI